MFRWICFRIRLWFFSIIICFPIPWLEWTPWYEIFKYEIIGLSYTKSLISHTELDIYR